MLLDIRGEFCPFPALHAKRAMECCPADDTITLLTDCAPALDTIAALAARQGFRAEILKVKDAEWQIVLSRNSAPPERKGEP